MKDIFERDRSGELIALDDPEYFKIHNVIENAQQIIAQLNTAYHPKEQVRALFAELTGEPVDESFELLPPFYTDFGRNIRVGKNVFINHACTFMDRGGITLEDGVLVGPKVNIITINHPAEPKNRRATVCKPVVIKKRAWLGVGATVLPGVTVGEYAVVSAGAVVTKDVPAYAIVAGVPAKIIRTVQPQ